MRGGEELIPTMVRKHQVLLTALQLRSCGGSTSCSPPSDLVRIVAYDERDENSRNIPPRENGIAQKVRVLRDVVWQQRGGVLCTQTGKQSAKHQQATTAKCFARGFEFTVAICDGNSLERWKGADVRVISAALRRPSSSMPITKHRGTFPALNYPRDDVVCGDPGCLCRTTLAMVFL